MGFYNGIFEPFTALRMGNGTRDGATDPHITYMTDGLCQVFAAAGVDCFVSFFGRTTVLVFDEVHSPSVRMELLMQQLPELIIELRDDYDITLHAVFMTATMDAAKFKRHFPSMKEFVISGTTPFPLEYRYPSKPDYGRDRPHTIICIMKEIIAKRNSLPGGKQGRMAPIIFVTGKEEGFRLTELINEQLSW